MPPVCVSVSAPQVMLQDVPAEYQGVVKKSWSTNVEYTDVKHLQ